MSQTLVQQGKKLKYSPQTQNKKLLGVIDSHFQSKEDPYDSNTNTKGFINFGVAINTEIMKKTVTYLPPWMNVLNCHYQTLKGSPKICEIVARNTPYSPDETIVLNNLLGVLDNLISEHRKISIQGHYDDLECILTHSNAEIVEFQDSTCQLIFVTEKTEISTRLQQTEKELIFIIKDPSQIVETSNKKIIYAYQLKFSEGYKAGVCHSRDLEKIKDLEEVYIAYPLSSLIASTIESLHDNYSKQIIHATLKEINSEQNYTDSFIRMLEAQGKYSVDKNNLYFGLGATNCLANLSFCIFKPNDVISLDAPFYHAFKFDFRRSGIIFDDIDIFDGTLFSRIQRAYEKGSKGYVITHPHNPSGKVFSIEEMTNIFEWVSTKIDFQLIVDQMYFNSTHSPDIQVKSGLNYANRFPNIHVLRGLSKDYGMSGLKIGMLISCHPKIRQGYAKWRELNYPQPVVLKAISSILKKTNYGLHIIQQTRQILESITKFTKDLLHKYQIDYVQSHGGCFLMLNLTKTLKANPQLDEESLWKIIFYEGRINMTRAKDYNMKQQGFYRFCYVVEREYIQEGLRRLYRLLNGEDPLKQI